MDFVETGRTVAPIKTPDYVERPTPISSSATIASSQLATDCADGVSTNCAITKWTISSDVDTGMTYMAYDNAEHPSDVTEVWLR